MEGEHRQVKSEAEFVSGKLGAYGVPCRHLESITKPVRTPELDLAHQSVGVEVAGVHSGRDFFLKVYGKVHVG